MAGKCGPSWLLLSSQSVERAVRHPVVVVVKAPEDWAGEDTTGELRGSWNGLLLSDSLVGPRVVVEDDVLGEEAREVRVIEHEDMVEQLAAKRANEAFGEAFMFGVRTADRTTRAPTASKIAAKREPSLVSRSVTRTSGCTSMVALRACWAHQSSVGALVAAA